MNEEALKDFAAALVPLIQRWYADPEHMQQFESWLKKEGAQK